VAPISPRWRRLHRSSTISAACRSDRNRQHFRLRDKQAAVMDGCQIVAKRKARKIKMISFMTSLADTDSCCVALCNDCAMRTLSKTMSVRQYRVLLRASYDYMIANCEYLFMCRECGALHLPQLFLEPRRGER